MCIFAVPFGRGRAEAGIREPERVIRRKIIDKTGSKYNKVPRTRLTRALIPQEIAAGSLQREIDNIQ